MPSLIQGYNYDIFISYRQKDNKHDGWVTEFVDNLKGELESTFKEEVSVYFDINPSDGLLETHDVDESLKEKLKCFVFIPIISRTYCDPKSFAWEHEFKAFVEEASKDQYGLKVKLPNGNVEGRVLPVQIHDLDAEDQKLCESVLKGVIRGIEFIYKEPGIDKPLTPDDDENKNLNNTKYRIQIVKVAHSIKDIITAIQHYHTQKEEASQEVIESESEPVHAPVPQKINKTPIIITSIIALALIILGILFIPKLFTTSEELEKSIAVLPFKNDSPDQERMYFINGTMEAILDNLCKIKELRVPGRTSVEQYRDNLKPIPTIAKELDVNYILEGSGHRDGNNVRLFVQLLDARKDKHLWSVTYDSDIEDIFSMQSEIAQLVATEIEAIITPEEKDIIERIPTTNLTAFDFYQRGKDEYSNYLLNNDKAALISAEDFYHRALEYDATYAEAFTGLAQVYWEKHYDEEYFSRNFMDSVLYLANTALSFDNNLAEAYSLRGDYYRENADYGKATKEYEKALEINPNYWQAYYGLAYLYYYQRDHVNGLENAKIALKLNHDPKQRPELLSTLAHYLGLMGFYDEAKGFEIEALELHKDSMQFFNNIARIAIYNDKYSEAIWHIKRYLALNPDNSSYYNLLGQIYYQLREMEAAIECFNKYIAGLDTVETIGLRTRHRVGYCYLITGHRKKAEEYFELQKKYCEESIVLNRYYALTGDAYYDLACINAYRNDKKNAYKNLSIYIQKSGQNEYKAMLWYFKTDPFFNDIRNEPKFQAIYHEIETKYNNSHEKVRKWLEENVEL
jgi:TolB-like protein/Flp pilus assembly protein TadD